LDKVNNLSNYVVKMKKELEIEHSKLQSENLKYEQIPEEVA
jgi:hypothetical protein